MKYLLFILVACLSFLQLDAKNGFKLIDGKKSASLVYTGHEPVVRTAIDLLIDDSKEVAGTAFTELNRLVDGSIVVGTYGQERNFDDFLAQNKVDLSGIKGKWEAFQLQLIESGTKNILLVIGSDARGTAYGVLEISRMMGVSPWKWWADVKPEKKTQLSLPQGYKDIQSPSVQYRGIFLNDEDWGLNPWSSQTFEPDAKIRADVPQDKMQKMHTIGPRTYAKIFELLLRLRANTIWPAMHEVTVPFYFVQGNREIAEKYGISIGSAHNEPLARNSATEWDIVGEGPYNYLTNKANIIAYWETRLKELKNSNNIFTMGMRGKHDGQMEGVKTTEQYRIAIDSVLKDQTVLLRKYIAQDPAQIPQVVIPYKEILDVYNAGMHVPDYVTLMWCDDNYGYLTHFPNAKEKKRAGGNGVYYHISYWGRPHDYLWLSTMSPALIHHQMNQAYQHDAKKMWIVNVGDIKPGEYQTELFLDMAWDIDKVNQDGVEKHLKQWLSRKFGKAAAGKLTPLMIEYYRLAHIRKPEFLGNTRTEEKDTTYLMVKDLPWSEHEINERLQAYGLLEHGIMEIEKSINKDQADAFFELIKYPVLGAAEMNKKLLYAQLARHEKSPWSKSHAAYDRIAVMTQQYNALQGGKWNRMMDFKPRNLTVFDRVKETKVTTDLPTFRQPLAIWNGSDFKGELQAFPGLGYGGKAAGLTQGKKVYADLGQLKGDSITVEIHLLPNHPIDNEHLRAAVGLQGGEQQIFTYKTVGRSEEWKENVLRNQAIRVVRLPVEANGDTIVELEALDEGVVVDQMFVYK